MDTSQFYRTRTDKIQDLCHAPDVPDVATLSLQTRHGKKEPRRCSPVVECPPSFFSRMRIFLISICFPNAQRKDTLDSRGVESGRGVLKFERKVERYFSPPVYNQWFVLRIVNPTVLWPRGVIIIHLPYQIPSYHGTFQMLSFCKTDSILDKNS